MADNSAFILSGIALIWVGAFVDGSLGLALKYTRGWRWEHLWLVYSVLAFAIIPWILSFQTIRDLPGVLGAARSHDMWLVFAFGIGWGCGAVLFGVSLKLAGMALSYAIAVGLGAAVGSFAPLALLHREALMTRKGLVVVAGVLLVMAGVALCSWAGHVKDRRLPSGAEVENSARWKLDLRVRIGIMLAILSGLLNPMINLSLAYGAPIAKLALDRGAPPHFALNVIWAIAMTAGALVNAVYCGYLISKAGAWSLFFRPSLDHLIGLAMGLLGPVGLLLYGVGSARMGNLAEVIGWPILCSMGILSANFWGAVTGEWSGTGRKPFLIMALAITVLIGAMFVLGWSSTLP